MPIVEVANDPGFRTPLGAPPEPPTDYGNVVGAAFRKTNTVFSMVQALRNSGPFTPEPGYNALKTIKGTPYEDNYLNRFAGVSSEAETQSIISQIDQEQKDAKTLDGAGTIGTIAQMVAGTLDPTMALPGAVGIKVGKEGYTFGKAALEVGSAVAAQSTAQEAVLQGSQQTRPISESVLNVGSATLLGALIGEGAARRPAPEQRAMLVKSLDTERAAMDAHAGNVPTGTSPIEQVLSAETTPPQVGAPLATAAGAAVTDTRKLELVPSGIEKIPVLGKVMEGVDPMTRLLNSPSVSARRAAVDLAETPLRFQENLEGIPTTAGPALERLARLAINQTKVGVSDELDRLFAEYRFGDADTSVPRTRAKFDTFMGRGEGYLPFDQFKSEISQALTQGDRHDIPQVEQAAQYVRAKVFNPWKDRAVAAGLLPEGIETKTADSYFQRVYNKQAITAKRPEFVNTVLDWLKSDQANKAGAKDRLTGYAESLRASQARIDAMKAKAEKVPPFDKRRSDLEYDMAIEEQNADKIRAKVEAEIAAWEGKSTAEAKSAIRTRERAAAEAGRAADAPRLKGADSAVDRAVKRITESDRDLSDAELRDRAHEITERILGSPDGRLAYEAAAGGPEVGYHGGGEPARGPLHSREFNIPDAMIRPWLEQDVEHVINAHLRTMVPDVLLAERFGDTRMTEAFRKIEDDFARLIDTTKNEADRTRLGKQREAALRDLAGVRDRIRGVYGSPVYAAMKNAARMASAAKNFNVITSLGTATISSLPDMAGPIFRHGLLTTFRDAWLPWFNSLTRQSGAYKEAKEQFRAMGIATETFSAQRSHAMNDIMDSYRPQSRLERTLQYGADKFMVANLLGPWTDWGKTVASMVAGSEILRASAAVAGGTITKRQLANLAESGIDRAMAERIHKAFKAGGEVRDGVHLPNTEDWADRSAREAFEGAVAREADIAIVTPGQEKPLWLSNPVLSVLGQFKSFTAAATQRVLIANLQRRDAQVMQGVLFSLGLGMVSYKLNSLFGGQPTSDRPQDWIKEAISRGNLLGWIEEGNALSSKMTRGGVDLYRMIGSDHPMSRYAGRTVLDQMLGPTAGKVESLAKVTGATASRDWNDGDVKALRRLTAFQNLFYLRGLFNQVEAGADHAFGIPTKAPSQH